MRSRLRTNERGAVMLLAIYFSAIAILLLNSIGLQRSMGEIRAAQRHVQVQHAFWLAEASLDQALAKLRTSATAAIPPYPDPSGSPDAYGIAYRVEYAGTNVLQDGNLEAIRRVLATGTASSGVQTTLTADFITPMTVDGVFTNDRIDMRQLPLSVTANQRVELTLQGNMATASGKRASIELENRTTVTGDVTVNMPDSDPALAYDDLWHGYHSAITGDGDIEGAVTAELLEPLRPPALPPSCDPATLGPVTFAAGEHVLMDGAAGVDQSGSAEDDAIVICATEVRIEKDAVVEFRKPTVIYVDNSFTNKGMVSGRGSGPSNGLLIVGLQANGNRAGMGISPGKMKGSVYAPGYQISLSVSPADELPDWNDLNERRIYRGDYDTVEEYNAARAAFERELDDAREKWKDPVRRDFGYLVGRHVYVNGVDVKLDRARGNDEEEALEDLRYQSWGQGASAAGP